MMRPPRWLAVAAAAWMVWLLVSILLALPAQPLGQGGSALVAFPWGRVTLNDLYAGFFVVAVWMAVTVRPWGWVVFWLAVLAVLGNVSALGLLAWRGWRAPSLVEVFVPRRS
jgi:hypothetical protein